eukprot:TRINITY_DN2068_c0_g1_i1.p1 TRINITY_DN2068_c0_g1~~TRINITY_DN2068_c0_g1_i1.p1  ORF type:complete len:329 (+),score=23.97 TRINITY_DN2068_c0_g1_i1:73-987(+)
MAPPRWGPPGEDDQPNRFPLSLPSSGGPCAVTFARHLTTRIQVLEVAVREHLGVHACLHWDVIPAVFTGWPWCTVVYALHLNDHIAALEANGAPGHNGRVLVTGWPWCTVVYALHLNDHIAALEANGAPGHNGRVLVTGWPWCTVVYALHLNDRVTALEAAMRECLGVHCLDGHELAPAAYCDDPDLEDPTQGPNQRSEPSGSMYAPGAAAVAGRLVALETGVNLYAPSPLPDREMEERADAEEIPATNGHAEELKQVDTSRREEDDRARKGYAASVHPVGASWQPGGLLSPSGCSGGRLSSPA